MAAKILREKSLTTLGTNHADGLRVRSGISEIESTTTPFIMAIVSSKSFWAKLRRPTCDVQSASDRRQGRHRRSSALGQNATTAW